jgi:hypothetical protein
MRKRYFRIIFIVIIGLVAIYYGFRGVILKAVLEKITIKSEQSFDVKISYTDAGFVGFNEVFIKGLKVNFLTGDTIMVSDSLVISPRLIPLLFGKKRLKEVNVYNTSLTISGKLWQMLRSKRSVTDSALDIKQRNYAQTLNILQSRFFTYLPSRIIIRNSGFLYKNDSISSSVFCENFNYQNDDFLGELLFSDKQKKSRCLITGSLNKGGHKLTATLSHTDSSLVRLPFLEPLWQSMIGFDTLSFSASFDDISKSQTDIVGFAAAHNLAIQNKRIGPEAIITQSAGFHFTFHIGNDYAELDSTSNVRINKFSFSPYFRFEHNSSRKLAFSFIRKEFNAQEMFESFPSGLFSNFKGIRTSGRLAYHLKIGIDLDHPDSVVFDSQLENKGFKIDKYGVTDFRMLNNPFVHEVYDNDRYITSILVGPDNPDFVPLDQISPYFKYSVLTAEDGDFFYHRGFNERAFRESIATNLKEKRFARGGSTISMQLVKNVFLNGDKTISRKIEEALIVWIIENLHLVSKERMFEVYLNIIELGPGVYGIRPASEFYFRKPPADLNLVESIYLSSIIPRPKGFRYTFDENGNLRDYFTSYFKLLSSIMVRRNQIPPMDTVNLKPILKLTGPAKKLLAKPDTTAREDSIFFKELAPGTPFILNED